MYNIVEGGIEMLYDNDNLDEEKALIENFSTKKINIKKIAIFITSTTICFFILIGSFFISYNKNIKKNIKKNIIQETSTEPSEIVSNGVVSSKGNLKVKTHIQIAKHNEEKIKSKFIPEYNENAQTDIKNLYFSTEKVAYLTFDDGPSANITPQILDTLKLEGVPATFFVVGQRVKLHPELVKRAYDEGHYIANHGYSHSYSKIYQSVDTVFGEYVECENAVREALGIPDYRMFLFRFPGGSAGGRYASIKAEAKDFLNSYSVVHTNWNCMTGDAEGKNTLEDQMNELKATMEGDDTIIVLMHDASDKQVTADTLPEAIHYLKEQGYTFKNFYEIF